MGTSPGLVYGQIPTAGEWNGYFIRKLDDLGYVYAQPGTGATLESGIEQGGWILEPPGSIAELTIIAPPGTFDGQRFTVSTTDTIDELTLEAASGQVWKGGGPYIFAGGGAASWIFRLASLTWYAWK